MHITRISLSGFRNLVKQDISFPERVTAIVGDNGQGKTNLLESIYLLSQARSFRTSKQVELIAWNEKPRSYSNLDLGDTSHIQDPFSSSESDKCTVSAKIIATDGEKEIKYDITPAGRNVYINAKRISNASSFYGQVRVVEFGAHDLEIIKGAPSCRRRFMDRAIAMLDRTYVERAVAYSRALKSRNAIIRENRENFSKSKLDEFVELLSVWNTALAQHGHFIARMRFDFIQGISQRFKRYYQILAGSSDNETEIRRERASVRYCSDFLDNSGVIKSQDDIEMVISQAIKSDFAKSTTSVGIQRDDLEIDIDVGSGEKSARHCASQGQTRSLALALKLATADFLTDNSEGDAPIFLLDDIESELDMRRKKALFKLIAHSKSQFIITLPYLLKDLENIVPHLAILQITNGLAEVRQTTN